LLVSKKKSRRSDIARGVAARYPQENQGDLGTDHHRYIQNQLLALEGGSLASLEEAANDR
jgi:hypothetical protein